MQDDEPPFSNPNGAPPARSEQARGPAPRGQDPRTHTGRPQAQPQRGNALADAAAAARSRAAAQSQAKPEAAGPDDTSGPAARWGGRVLRGFGHMLMVLVPLVVLPALAIGLGYVRLRHGPVSLKFLAGPIERGIATELPGVRARIEDVVLRFAENGRVEFRLRNLQIFEADGDLVASAPLAAVEISGAALRAFRIVPARVELIRPQLTVTMADDGRLSLAFNQAPPLAEPGEVPAKGAAKPADTAPEGSGPPAGSAPTGTAEASGAAAGADPAAATTRGDTAGTVAAAAPDAEGRVLRRIDLARMLADASARARRREDAASYLREIGVRDATLTFFTGASRMRWTIPQVAIDLEHRRQRSVVWGNATISSPRGPWTLSFLSEDHDEGGEARSIVVRSSVRGLVPAALAEALPDLPMLSLVDVPLSGDATLDLGRDGQVRDASLAVEMGRGQLLNVSGVEVPVAVDAGLLKLRYHGDDGRIELEPSTVVAGASRATLVGEMKGEGRGGQRVWPFSVKVREGVLGAGEFGLDPVPIDALSVSGRVLPAEGLVHVDSGVLKAAGAELTVSGDAAFKAATTAARLEGHMSPMTAAALKTIWPKAVAPGARVWVGENLRKASITGGTLRWTAGMGADASGGMGAAPGERNRLSLAIEAADVVLTPVKGSVPVEAPRVLTRLEGQALEVAIPEAAAVLPSNRRVPLKGVRFAIADTRPEFPDGEVSLRVLSPLPQVLELLDQPPFELLRKQGVKLDGADGKVDAQMKIGWPLAPTVDPSQVHIEGKGRVSDGRVKQLGGAWDVQGIAIAFDISDKAADATGDMLVAGVPAKIAWQHIFDAPEDKQPPLRITAKVDNSDRNQLGLDVNHIVQGDVPVEVTVTRGAQGEPNVRLRADLTAAELTLDNISWRKPAGHAAALQFDVVKGTRYKAELQNFKLAGDDIAIDGWAALGNDNRLREFHFKDLSLNLVSRLEMQGSLRNDNVWDIKAHGTVFDGRDFFRSLFHVGHLAERPQKQLKPRAGVDLTADFDTVLGFSEVSLRSLKMKVSRRGEKLVGLDARGSLDGGQPVVVELRGGTGSQPRMLLADSTDAGQAFRLIGFYPNAQGGRVRLEVNLDGRGQAEKTGILWVDDFRVLGDPVVSEVVGSADTSRPAIEGGKRGRTKVVRETFAFDHMKAPFLVGHGQFVLEDSYLKGPLLGATLRGKVDYNSKIVNIGGTYIPLQGLNNVLGDIPLVGQILSGPRNEGIFGITFAIQGAMAQPQVIVNPLSVVAPGIFREIFQMTNPDTSVRPVPAAKPQPPAEARVRASSTPASGASRKGGDGGAGKGSEPAAQGEMIDGWSSGTQSKPRR